MLPLCLSLAPLDREGHVLGARRSLFLKPWSRKIKKKKKEIQAGHAHRKKTGSQSSTEETRWMCPHIARRREGRSLGQ